MSLDNRCMKSRNIKRFLKSNLNKQKSTFTNSNYEYLNLPTDSNTTIDLPNFLNINTISNKTSKKVSFDRKIASIPCIPQFSSTVESTINTITSRVQEENKNDCSCSTIVSQRTIITQKCNETEKEKNIVRKELIKPQNDDMKILFEIIFDKKFDLFKIRKYIILMQKNFIYIGNNMIENEKKFEDDEYYYYVSKLEELISRYSLFIFIFIKANRQFEAKKLFLLMLKENINYINIIEKELCKYQKKMKIEFIKFSLCLNKIIKIYSFIIKYCQLFILNKYLYYFMDKYFHLQILNFNLFTEKEKTKKYSEEKLNHIKYIFSCYLHNCSYFSLLNYFPLKVPLACLKYISNLYEKDDELSLTNVQKSFLLKNLYNEGILKYVNGQKKESINYLKLAKDKISLFTEEELYTILPNNNLINSHMISCENSPGKKQKLPYFYFGENNDKPKNDNDCDISSDKNVNEKTKESHIKLILKIYKSYNKEKFKDEDIKMLVKYGIEKGIWNDNLSDITKNNYNFLNKYQSISDFGKNILRKDNDKRNKIRKQTFNYGVRPSHIDFTTQYKMKDFFIPKYYKNPLLRRIELLMCEIELESKNYNHAYEHILNVLYLLLLTKISTNHNKFNKEFDIDQRLTTGYLKIIEKLYLQKNNKLNVNNKNICNSNEKKNNNIHESNKKIRKSQEIIDNKQKKELEKFFIFLSGLSVYQIKILNETQPDTTIKNDLPLCFDNSFLDTLSISQKNELASLQTMILGRSYILKDPNKWIVPSNLNLNLLNNEKNPIESEKNLSHENKIDPQIQNIFDKILNSSRITLEIKKFFSKNYALVLKILKSATIEEIKNIIKYPYIIIDSIKRYKNRAKKINNQTKNIKNCEKSLSTVSLDKYQYLGIKPESKKARIFCKIKNGEVIFKTRKIKKNSVELKISRDKCSSGNITFINGNEFKDYTKTVDCCKDCDDSYSEERVLIPEYSFDE